MFHSPSCTEINGVRNSKCQEVFLTWNVDNKFHFTKSSVFPPWCVRRKSCSSWIPSISILLWLKWCQQFPFFSKFWTGRRRNGGTCKQRKLAVGRNDCENSCPYQPIFFPFHLKYIVLILCVDFDCWQTAWKEPVCYSWHFWQIGRQAIQLGSAANPEQSFISSQKLNPTETKHLPFSGTLGWRQKSWLLDGFRIVLHLLTLPRQQSRAWALALWFR